MKVSYNKLPKSLKKELDDYRKSEGISTKDMIKKIEKNDQVAFSIVSTLLPFITGLLLLL